MEIENNIPEKVQTCIEMFECKDEDDIAGAVAYVFPSTLSILGIESEYQRHRRIIMGLQVKYFNKNDEAVYLLGKSLDNLTYLKNIRMSYKRITNNIVKRDKYKKLYDFVITKTPLHELKQLYPDKFVLCMKWFLFEAFNNGWKRYGNNVMEPLYVDGLHTRTYIKRHFYNRNDNLLVYDTIQQWVQKRKSWESGMGEIIGIVGMERIYKELCSCDCLYFPVINPNRYLFSFKNGIYNTLTCEFTYWEVVDTNVCCCNYFNDDFDVIDYIDDDTKDNFMKGEWFHEIKTPYMDKVIYPHIKDQENCDYIYRMIFAIAFGRFFRPLSKCNNEQMISCFVGNPSTGKSCIADMLRAVYPVGYIGTISNNIEERFGLMTLYNKYVLICNEMGRDFALPRPCFLLMADGSGGFPVAIKNKGSIELERWEAYILLLGNLLPIGPGMAMKDEKGEILRRLFVVYFKTTVEEKDEELVGKLINEIPAFIKKATLAYKLYESKRYIQWIKEYNIKYFDTVKQQVISEKSIMMQFLNGYVDSTKRFRFAIKEPPTKRSKGVKNVKPTHEEKIASRSVYMPLPDFKRLFYCYCDDVKVSKTPAWNSDLYDISFKFFKLTIEGKPSSKYYPRSGYKRSKPVQYILGVDWVNKTGEEMAIEMECYD